MKSNAAVMVADQAVSTLSNFVLAIGVAHSVSPATFGIYAILASLYWVGLGSGRVLVCEPLLIFRGDLQPDYGDHFDGVFVSASVALGCAAGVLLIVAALCTGQLALAVLGLAFPFLLWEDVIRYVMLSRKRVVGALVIDTTWLVVQASATVACIAAFGRLGLSTWIGIWGASGAIAAVAVTVWTGVTPSVKRWRAILLRIRKTSVQLFADFMIVQGGQQLVVFVLPVITSFAVLGALKACQVAVGPVNTAMTAGALVAIPSLAELGRQRRFSQAVSRSAQLSLGIGCAAAAYAMILTFLPLAVGRAFFGATWISGSRLVIYVGLQAAMTGVSVGAQTLMRATKNTGVGLKARGLVTPVNLVLPLVGAAVDGIIGLGVAILTSSVLSASVWWMMTMRVMRSLEERPSPGGQSQLPHDAELMLGDESELEFQ